MISRPPNSKMVNILAVVLLAGVMLAFYFPAIFDGKVIAPHNMSGWYPWKGLTEQPPKDNYGFYTLNDILRSFYPYHHFIKEDFSLKSIWAWDPYRGCGIPFLYLSPGVYLFSMLFLQDAIIGTTVAAILLMFLSGVAMFYFLREMELGTVSSLIGAAAYMLNSYSLVYSGFIHELTASTLLPVTLLFAEKAVRKAMYASIAPLAIVLAAILYSGKLQLSVHAIYLMLIYVIFRLFLDQRRGRTEIIKVLAIFAVAGVLAALMYLPQAAAMYELAKNSGRLSETFDFFAPSKYPMTFFITATSLKFFGMPLTSGFWGTGFMFKLVECYIGPVILVIIFASALDRKKGQMYFWSAVLCTALLMTLSNTVFKLFVDYVPGFGLSKSRPTEIILFSSFILASVGLDNLINYKGRRAVPTAVFAAVLACAGLLLAAALTVYAYAPLFEWVARRFQGINAEQLSGAVHASAYALLMAVLCSSAILLYLKGRLRSGAFQAVVVVLAITDIFVVNRQLRYVQEPSVLYKATVGIEFIKKDKEVFRIMRFGPWNVAPTATLECFDIQDAQIYDSLLNNRYTSYIRNIEDDIIVLNNRNVNPLKNWTSLGLPAFSLLNVKYLLSIVPIESPACKLVYDKEMKIYQNLNYLPRAFVAHKVKVSNKDEILASLRDRSFRPGETVFLEEDPGFTPPPATDGSKDEAKIKSYSSNKVVVDVKTDTDGFLVLTDTYWPDWKAYVDGNEAKVYAADYLFRAVSLKKGVHEVSFLFRPDWLNKYYLAAGLAFTITIIILVGYWKRF